MFNVFYNQCWAIYPDFANCLMGAISAAVKGGPVDDAARSGLNVQKAGSTAIVNMKGPMIKDAGYWSYYGFAGTRDTSQALQAAVMDDDIESILWVIDSPGGSVDGLVELADTVKQVAAIKPITVQVDGMMASAALYAASHATAIYAGQRDLVGSIGTRIMLYDYSEMFKEAGIKAIPIDTGEHKSAGAMGTEITEAQQEEFQRIANGYFSDFKQVVTQGRNVSGEDFDLLADGRVFFANEEPIDFGLIDGVQPLQETVNQLVKPTQSHRQTAAKARLSLLSI